jgi:hypothetical protein
MALLEIVHDRLELAPKLAIIQLQYSIHQPLCAAVIGLPLPSEVEWSDDDPRRIRLEPKRMEL